MSSIMQVINDPPKKIMQVIKHIGTVGKCKGEIWSFVDKGDPKTLQKSSALPRVGR